MGSGVFRPAHIIIVAAVFMLFFGAKRLPDVARSLGRSMRILKAETRGLAEDDVQAKAEAQAMRQPLVQGEPVTPQQVVDPVDRIKDR